MNGLGQSIGFLYLVVFVLSFQFSNKKVLIHWRITSKIFATIHYILIGASSGAIAQFIGIFPDYFSYKYETQKTKMKVTACIFIMIFIIVGLLSFNNIYDLFPIVGSILAIIVIFQEKTKYIRTAQFVISPLFLIYNIVSNSYAGIITEIFVMLSCFIGILRLDRNKDSK